MAYSAAGRNLEQIPGTLGNLNALNSSIASATLQQSHVVDDINQSAWFDVSLYMVHLCLIYPGMAVLNPML